MHEPHTEPGHMEPSAQHCPSSRLPQKCGSQCSPDAHTESAPGGGFLVLLVVRVIVSALATVSGEGAEAEGDSICFPPPPPPPPVPASPAPPFSSQCRQRQTAQTDLGHMLPSAQHWPSPSPPQLCGSQCSPELHTDTSG
jgi:hypothetical protein